MNTKISQALGDNKSGDIINYFNEVDKIIELNMVSTTINFLVWNVMTDLHLLQLINIQNSIYQMLRLIVLILINHSFQHN